MNTIDIKYGNLLNSFEKGTTYYEICKYFDVLNKALAVNVDNQLHHLSEKVFDSCNINIITVHDVLGNKIYKNGILFIFESALKNIYSDIEVSFEHSVPTGVLAKISNNYSFQEEDVNKVKNEMNRLIHEDIMIKKLTILKEEAIDYYKHSGYFEKGFNIQNISDKVVSIYSMLGRHNYFYTLLPYSTGIINKFNVKLLDSHRLIVLTPNLSGELTLYTNCDNIINSFYKGKCLLEDLDVNYLCDINKKVCTNEINKFIKSCELVFNLSLAQAAKKITDNKNIKFILIAGPSSSGKTTTCRRLADYLNASGYDTIRLSIDDYYVDRDLSPKDENGNYDFECLEVIDVEGFNIDLNNLLKGESVRERKYNFITGKKEYTDKFIKLENNSIILIEGLHALNNKLTPSIDDKYKFKIYLSPFIPLNIDRHNYISTIDLRLLRRIIRDNRTRGYKVENTIESWQRVRNGEEKYIFPYIPDADIIINTALAYEVGALKVFAEPLLYSVDINDEYYEEARRLLNFLKPFYMIPGEYIPEDSILREFIGGRYND